MSNTIKFLKEHYWFLIIATFIFFVLSPAIGLDLTGSDWSNFTYIINNFGHGFLPFKIPLSFYFTQYGTLYASIAYAMQFLGTNPTLHYLNNIFLRIVASFAIYLLVNWWSRRKGAGVIAGLFFGISYPGIESTTWSVHFLTYISVVLLCIFLYLWKKFHDFPTKTNLYYSLIFFVLTIFIAHIKIFALPLLVLIGEFYALVVSKRQIGFFKLKVIHALCLLITFSVLYLGTDLMKTTPELSGKMLHPYIILQGLINGYPPIVQSLFLFVSNLVIPPDFLKFLESTRLVSFNQSFVWILSLVMALIGFVFFIYLLIKKHYWIAFASLIAIIFPVSIYYSTEMLKIWEITWIISTIVGGTLFILIALTNFIVWKNNRRVLELAMLSIILLVGHLLIPWLAFTQFEVDTQSAFHLYSRYYTVPAMGMGILWGLVFTCALDSLGHLRFNSFLKFKSYLMITIIILIAYLFISHALFTNIHIRGLYQYFDRSKHEHLWNITSPHFLPLVKNPGKKFVYIEGNLNPKVLGMIDYFSYQIYVNYENLPPSTDRSFVFLSNKAEVLGLLKKELVALKEKNTEVSNIQNFVALRINNGEVEDIEYILIQEANNEK